MYCTYCVSNVLIQRYIHDSVLLINVSGYRSTCTLYMIQLMYRISSNISGGVYFLKWTSKKYKTYIVLANSGI